MKKKLYSTYKKFLADTLTPVSIYLNIRKEKNAFLLESSDYHGDEHNYSFICFNPLAAFKLEKDIFSYTAQGNTTSRKIAKNELISAVEQVLSEYDIIKDFDFPFITNGFFGYIAFDTVQYFEDIQLSHQQPEIPLLQYFLFEYIIAFNHFNHELYIFKNNFSPITSDGDLDEVFEDICATRVNRKGFKKTDERTSNLTPEAYLEMVKKGIQHCYRGDVFQIVLSRCFEQGFEGDDFKLYRALRSINPSPYLFYFDLGDFHLMGSSPEAQLIINKNKVTIHPIAGTFRRTGDDVRDLELSKKLEQDPKENAEHVMLVDLARNDLSRNGKNVTVEVYREVQFYSHVIHLVSKVTAEIPEHTAKFKLVGDTFPAGTLSGAPKYKAMQLIDRLEPTGRGFYGGCIGHLNFNGDFNSAIMIRTFLSKDNNLIYQAGAGVVADSIPENELQEVENKLAALNKAIDLAENI